MATQQDAQFAFISRELQAESEAYFGMMSISKKADKGGLFGGSQGVENIDLNAVI